MGNNQKEVKCKLYLQILTIIFAISMIAGYEQIVIGTFRNIHGLNIKGFGSLVKNIHIFLPLFMCSLVLLRFFFAPICNVKAVLEKSSIQYQKSKTTLEPWIIMLFDIPVLLTHSIIFSFMCQSAKENIALLDKQFYHFFMALLLLNSIWLVTIRLRTKEKFFCLDVKNRPHVFWALNNTVVFFLLLFSLRLNWYIEWLFVFINCVFDLGFTADAYFKVSYRAE